MDIAESEDKMFTFMQKFALGEFPYQRLGQAFCNHFNLHDPTLFYQTDPAKASDYILTNYSKSLKYLKDPETPKHVHCGCGLDKPAK